MNRNVESKFSTLPSVNIQRSRFKRPFTHKTTFDSSKLIPILAEEILPGDTVSMDMASLVRMSTPVFPVMDNAYLDTFFFFVPNRLLWDHWKEFNGENSQGYWTQTIEYQVPQTSAPEGGWDVGSIADYFGIPIGVDDINVMSLPFRAYVKIWNEFFRDQNTMPPAFFDSSDNSTSGMSVAQQKDANDSFYGIIQNALRGATPLPVAKYHDYFTSTLPEPQKGPAVSLPILSEDLPVVTSFEENDTVGSAPMMFSNRLPQGQSGVFSIGAQNSEAYQTLYGYMSPGGTYSDTNSGPLIPNNLVVNVEDVAVATISQLRQAFQLQRLFERDALGGTRYTELLLSHFGVTSPDARLQRPEYLGGKRVPINVDQVLQTSATNDVSPQGNTAAFSLTSDSTNSFTKSFTEHGWIIGLCCVRTDHTYQQGIERMWSRKSRFDYYWPTLAHISEQPVLVKEIYAQGNAADDDAFGYQEAWADYRYKPSRVSGLFRSDAPQSLDSWHYADFYTSSNEEFVLNAEWLCESPNNIARTLAVQDVDNNQFIADFYFNMISVRPMPMYSVPGLIDHF